jgi:hypothetical protein
VAGGFDVGECVAVQDSHTWECQGINVAYLDEKCFKSAFDLIYSERETRN